MLKATLFIALFSCVLRAQECSICGFGRKVGNPDAFLPIPRGQSTNRVAGKTCRDWEDSGLDGQLSVKQCESLSPLAIQVCNCLPADKMTNPFESLDLIEVAARDPRLATFLALINDVGLTKTLKEGGPFTLLAPTNSAFDQTGENVMKCLMELGNEITLRDILLYHIFEGREALLSPLILDGDNLTMVNGDIVSFAVSEYAPFINIRGDGASLIDVDSLATNGVLHVLDRVLFPPKFASMNLRCTQTLENSVDSLKMRYVHLITGSPLTIIEPSFSRKKLLFDRNDSCFCSPTTLRLTVDLNSSCPRTLPQANGIKEAECFQVPASFSITDSTRVIEIQVIESNAEEDIINVQEYGPLENGKSVVFTSVTTKGVPVVGIQVNVKLQTVMEKFAYFSFAARYNYDCSLDTLPIYFERGASLGPIILVSVCFGFMRFYSRYS